MRVFGTARIVAIVAATCLVCAILSVWTLVQSHDAAIREGMRRVEGVALVIEQQADQMFAAVEQMLDLTARSLADHADEAPELETVAPLVAEGVRRLPQLRAVDFVDASGLRHPLAHRGVAVDYADGRPLLKRHRDDPSHRLRIVAQDELELTAAGRLFVSRRVDIGGSFAGIVLAELDLDYLRALYARIRLTDESSIGIVTLSGRLVIRIPGDEVLHNRDFRAYLANRPPGAVSGSTSIVSPFDGEVRLIGYRILADYPLLVFATTPRAEVLADWWANGIAGIGVALTLLLLLSLLSIQTVREIRHRRAAEESLRRSMVELGREKDLVEAILNALPDGTQLFDTRQRMIGWNDRLFSILTVDRDEVFAAADPTRRFFEILAGRGEYGRGDIDDLIRSRLDITRATEPFEYRRRLADGRWMECRGRPVAGRGLLAVYRDITSEVEHQERMVAIQASLEDARYDAERANRAKSEFLAGMSHELRTPLNSILGFSEIIGGTHFGRDAIDRYADYARDINQSATHLLALIDSLLDLAKIEAGRMELSEEEIHVDECVDRAMVMCRPVAAAKGVRVEVGPMPDVRLRADRQKLVQSLLNVLSNAVKFTPVGGRVRVGAALRADGMVFTVADTGIGIAAKDIEAVFEPFRQVKSGLAMNSKGTGLGMPLTKRLIELHGGRVDLDSEPGVGTTVAIVLPLWRVAERMSA